MWENWKVKHGKDTFYMPGVEDEYRLKVFYGNVQEIQEFYRGPKQSYTLGLNQLSDLTKEEFEAIYLDPKMEERMEEELANIEEEPVD